MNQISIIHVLKTDFFLPKKKEDPPPNSSGVVLSSKDDTACIIWRLHTKYSPYYIPNSFAKLSC
jgi:hypothetical protein